MSQIFGINGFGKLAVGYPVNINDMDIKRFTVDSSSLDGVAPGEPLAFTTKYGILEVMSADKKLAGIAVATNVKLDTVFPQGGSVNWKAGETGGYATRGEIAVKLDGSAPAPGAAVYYDASKKAFTTATKQSDTTTDTIALTNCRFTGLTEGTVTVVDILY